MNKERSHNNKIRVQEIDLIKGMAISLVVLGHIVAREPPAGNEWYPILKNWIYQFHMPLFMYLSGFSFFYFQKPVKTIPDYSRFLWLKARRLLGPVFLVGVVVVIGKALFSTTFYVDHPVENVWVDLFKLLYDPLGGAFDSVWFVYALFMLYLLTVPLLMITGWSPVLITIIGAAIHFIPLPDLFCLSRVGEYLFIYGIGGISVTYHDVLKSTYIKYRLWFFTTFLVLTFMHSADWNISKDWEKLIFSFAAIPVAHGIAAWMYGYTAKAFNELGIFSFSIYLLNTLFIGLTKAFLLKLYPWDGIAFLVFAPLLFAAGLIGPILTIGAISRVRGSFEHKYKI